MLPGRRVNCERGGLTNKLSKMFLAKMSNDLKLILRAWGELQTFVKTELERTQSFKPTYVALRIMVNTCAIQIPQGFHK